MKTEELIGRYVHITDMNSADEGDYKFKTGDVLKVQECVDTGSNSWKITFSDKPYSWYGTLNKHFKVVTYPKEWYKDKWIEIIQHVGHRFVLKERYQIKECKDSSRNGYSSFIFHNAPDELWNRTVFHISNESYKIVEGPSKFSNEISTNIVEIAKQQKETVLEKAIKEYPIGSYYYPLNEKGNPHTLYTDPEIVHHTPYYRPNGNIDGGVGYVYANGKWAEKAEKPEAKDVLLETAIKKYPIGTIVQPIDLDGKPLGDPKVITYTPIYHFKEQKTIKATDNGLVYAKGFWAEVIDKEYLLEKAKKKYPIGTIYKSADDDVRSEVKGYFYYASSIPAISDGYGGYIYYKGKWAEIVSYFSNKKEVEWPITPDVALELTRSYSKPSPESKISHVGDLNVKLLKPAGKKRVKQL